MKNSLNNIFFFTVLPIIMLLCSFPLGANTAMESDTFPLYDSIRPNVSFWKKIYTRYSTTQGVIHDKRNLAIIYDVIELKDRNRHGSRKINRERIKKAKGKYKGILAKLARGEAPSGPEEQRVAALFGTRAAPVDFRNAMRNLRCQIGQKEPFRQGIIRSGAYLAEIQQIFRDAGLPVQLAYLPHVESSFNPRAYSKFGAAGIWQFTRSTGKRFMTVGYTVDERRDPILSSHAAARLLKQNFEKLRNWPMAITAYNHGVSGMLRAKRRKENYEAIFKDYRSRIFRFASRNFYSEFLAAKEVAQNYQQYFGELELDTPLEFQEVLMAGYGALPEIAQQLKLELGMLSELNPALRNPVIRGQKYVPKGFRLRLPLASGQDWESMIAELAPKIFKSYQKHSRIYTVRRGDTAGEIARIHGLRLSDLIAANNLDARATIYVDQNLRIPLPDEKPITIARAERRKTGEEKVAKSQRKPANQTRPLAEPTVDLVIAMSETAESGKAQEKDAPESPLFKPAEGGVQKAEPPVLAGREADLFEEGAATGSQGQKQVKDNTHNATASDSDAKAAKPAVQAPKINPEILQGDLTVERVSYDQGKPVGTIRVEVEETLGHYADWLGITAREIRRLNGFPYGKAIRIAQKIKIPLHQVSKEEFEEKRFDYHKELSEDFFASYRIEKVKFYYIKKGDTIWDLALQEFEVPLWLIKKYNAELDFNALVPSQKLLIPIIEKNQV